MAIIRAAPIKNSKGPVYLSRWIFHSRLYLFPLYKLFYFTASIDLQCFLCSPSSICCLAYLKHYISRQLLQRNITAPIKYLMLYSSLKSKSGENRFRNLQKRPMCSENSNSAFITLGSSPSEKRKVLKNNSKNKITWASTAWHICI